MREMSISVQLRAVQMLLDLNACDRLHRAKIMRKSEAELLHEHLKAVEKTLVFVSQNAEAIRSAVKKESV